ncbi:hypothetical protein RGU70_17175 [Herbaspirillum sp. RTI4]|nr:hypothetical protein [Herbaspirillum sp. RTI4]MDY7580045.1 hypothetical protein [Herbaspirillum sp. RTI4]MEA9982972.1 hypothetical protein [Herbaspirillum sp. RTI4]
MNHNLFRYAVYGFVANRPCLLLDVLRPNYRVLLASNRAGCREARA